VTCGKCGYYDLTLSLCHANLWVCFANSVTPLLWLLFTHVNCIRSNLSRRVHISDKTLAFLNGEFEVEPAFGEKREELLRIAGLKTFFITKVVKPVSGGP